jgi:hypothetical protein
VGQVELFVEKGDGRLKAHPLCLDEGSCLQKVITGCSSGHGLIRKLIASCIEFETSKVDGRWTRSLRNRCAVSAALITVLSTRFQEKEMEDSRRTLCGFCLPGVENGGFRNRSLKQTRK